ncbi:galactose mutarotase-like protein [Eremomyces bilateralis CBS 781.70]|uniref:Galactose mutarotase-like protein n=1 Tax=Eremomyces bilateralis CBS 781.70 TaxID=1392243 RepID=A0A6G1FS89_9PEZI|nr:galactose mutarotase-like protein [Eremomyces bilateralis CBS 781.70]KAF1808647.1 galactose mutarotase-like protein [Eremomyces bilateralis CBS 781.70]
MASQDKAVAEFLPLGAIIRTFLVDGQNIVQNFEKTDEYRQYNVPHFGETIGRVANRISGAKINSLNSQSYELAANNGPNSLHGGPTGWGKRVFTGPEVDDKGRTVFRYRSADGEEGFPGAVELRVYYTASTEKSNGKETSVLEIEYEVEMVGNEAEEKDITETVVGITNHSYFNLNLPNSSIADTDVTLATSQHMVVDDTSIPTGPIESYPGISANKPFKLGPTDPDIDHCFILNEDPSSVPIDTRKLPLQRLIHARNPESRINLEVHSTEPAFQFYTGRYIDVPAAGTQPARGSRSGFCVEPSRYVNSINVDEWKGMVILKRGQQYGSKIVYKGWRE